MLSEWLAPGSVKEFVGAQLGRGPVARPATAAGARAALSWPMLGRVLGAEPAPDLLVVTAGRLVDVAAPRSLPEAQALMARGLGVVIRRAERHTPELAAVAAAFGRDLPGEVHLQLFVTPAGTNGFGWHYDFEEVFIAQTEGIKDYYFRDNTVDRQVVRGQQPDFSRFRAETSPLGTARLIPGDWLYLPARWWHMAKCVETSLSISVGVLPDL